MWSNKYTGNGGNRVRVVSRHGGTAGGGIFLDGNLYQSLEKDQSYRIEKALEEVTFCHPTSAAYGYNFFHTLRTKLYWHLEPGKDVHA